MTDHHPEEDAGQLYTRLVRTVGELGILVDPIRYSTTNAHDRDEVDVSEVAAKAAEVAELAKLIGPIPPKGPAPGLGPVEILTRHLSALTADLEKVLREGARGRYGPTTITEAIASTVEHIGTLIVAAEDELELVREDAEDLADAREALAVAIRRMAAIRDAAYRALKEWRAYDPAAPFERGFARAMLTLQHTLEAGE